MRQWWRTLWGVISILCLFLLAGCGSTTTHPVSAVPVQKVIDSTGVTVRVPVHPNRIVSYGVSTDDMVLGLVDPSRVVAISDLPGNAEEKRKQVAGRVTSSTEQVLAYQPDLVLMPSWSKPELIQQLRGLGLAVYVYQYPKSIAETEKTITLLGELLDAKSEATQLVTHMEDTLQAVSHFTEKVPEGQRKVVAFYAYGGFGGGAGTLFDQFCESAHLTNAARLAGLQGQETGSLEQLVAVNPDIIFIPTAIYDSGEYRVDTVHTLLENPALQGVKAVQQRAIYTIDARWLLNYSQFLVQAVVAMAREAYGYGQ